MTTFLIQREKLVRIIEVLSVDAIDEMDAKIRLEELSDPTPIEEVLDTRTELLAATSGYEVAA